MCLSKKSPITNCVAIPGRPPSLYSGAISPSMNSQSILPASCTSSCLMLMIWSSRARNKSPDPVVSCFLGRIAPSDAATESCFSIRGNGENEIASFQGLRHGNLAISSQQSRRKTTLAQWVRSSSRATKQSVLSFFASRSFFLTGELLLGKLSETVVVHGNAPHDRPRFLVSHLIGNRASFLCTKAPMPSRVISEWHPISGRDAQAIFRRRRHQHRFCGTTPSIADFWTNRGRRAAPLAATSGVPPILPPLY